MHFWAAPGSAPSAPPPSPNFLPTFRAAALGAPLRFPHELFSSARSNQRAPAPQAEPGLGASPPPRSRAPLPPPPGAAWPSPGPGQPNPAVRPRSAASLPLRLPPSPPARSAVGPQRAQRHSREGAGKRETGPPPASWGGTPRPRRDPDSSHVSLGSRPARPPARTPPASPCGGDAGPHLGAAARCPARPHGPALRLRPSPARGVGVYPLRGGSELGGLAPPKLRSDPTGARRRHGAPGSALLGFTRSRFGR